MTLPTDAKERKNVPMARGLLDYFPDALAAVADVSRVGNEQHNPGQPMHWAKHLSTDHADCLVRHLVDRGTLDTDGLRHSAKVAWRALALLQTELEEEAAAIAVADEPVGTHKNAQAGFDVITDKLRPPFLHCDYCKCFWECDRARACALKVDDPH